MPRNLLKWENCIHVHVSLPYTDKILVPQRHHLGDVYETACFHVAAEHVILNEHIQSGDVFVLTNFVSISVRGLGGGGITLINYCWGSF